MKNANSLYYNGLAFVVGARDEIRTHTGVTPLAPETSASTVSPPALDGTANIQKNFK